MFISFEGLDFSGKSTQVRRLVNRLERLSVFIQRGTLVHVLREPGGTTISERIRDLLLDRKNLALTDTAELLLFSASRAQLVSEVIRPAVLRGDVVVCDRYVDSTTAYQGHGRGIPLETVQALNAAATGGVMPELTLLIDIPVKEIRERKIKAGMAFDRMESSGAEFYERVRAGFHGIAAREPDRFRIIDGLRSVEEIQAEIWSLVEEKYAYVQLEG